MDLANVKLWNKLDFQFFSQCFEGNFNYPISQLQISIDVCAHLIDPMGIHFLHCAHSNKHIGTHDAICDTFVVIARNVDFHMG